MHHTGEGYRLRADAQPLAVMAPVGVDNSRQAFEVMEEMAEIKRSMWFKGRYRPDAVTVSLLLKAGVDGKLLDKLPRVLELMVPTTVLFFMVKPTLTRLSSRCFSVPGPRRAVPKRGHGEPPSGDLRRAG